MAQRKPNTDRQGNAWTLETKKSVWAKGETKVGYNSDLYRWDKCGNKMQWDQHGNRNSSVGWEIDHIDPVANGGGDQLWNLQPLNWANNANKGDKLNWKCPN